MIKISNYHRVAGDSYTKEQYLEDANYLINLLCISGIVCKSTIAPSIPLEKGVKDSNFIATCALPSHNLGTSPRDIQDLIALAGGKSYTSEGSGYIWFTFQKELMNETV